MKTLAFLTALLVLVGCDVEAQDQVKRRGHDIKEICIDGVVYLWLDGYQRTGITPKVDADFYPYTCPTTQK